MSIQASDDDYVVLINAGSYSCRLGFGVTYWLGKSCRLKSWKKSKRRNKAASPGTTTLQPQVHRSVDDT